MEIDDPLLTLIQKPLSEPEVSSHSLPHAVGEIHPQHFVDENEVVAVPFGEQHLSWE